MRFLPSMGRRRLLLALAAGATGCRRPEEPPREPLPARVDGYGRTEISQKPGEQAPETLRKLGVKQVYRAVYRGQAEVTLTAYEMTSEAGAFEALQTWRPVEGSLAFQAGALFLVAESSQADRQQLQVFAEAFERVPR